MTVYVPATTTFRVFAGIQALLSAAMIAIAVLVSGPDVSDSALLAVLFAAVFGTLGMFQLRDVLRRAPEASGARVLGADAAFRGELRWVPFYSFVLVLVPAFPEICAIPLSGAVVFGGASLVVDQWQARQGRVLVRKPKVRFAGRGVFDHRDYGTLGRKA